MPRGQEIVSSSRSAGASTTRSLIVVEYSLSVQVGPQHEHVLFQFFMRADAQ
jgi:hypothetical protein